MTFLGIFSTLGEKYYFRLEGSSRGVFETNIGKLGTQKIQFFFWVEGSIGECGRVWGSCEVGYVRRGQDVGVTRGGLPKVDHTRCITQGGSHQRGLCKVDHTRLRESPSEMFLSLIFHKSRAPRNIPSAK